MRRRTLFLLFVIVGLHPLVLAAQARGRSSLPPAAPARRAAAPLMSPALVAQLVERGKHQSVFPEVTRRSGGNGVMMRVLSNRQIIARASARAEETGEAYSPPPDVRRDEVTVTCGDTSSRRRLDCDSIVITNPSDKAVPPIASEGGPQTFHNEAGATWVVRMTTARYPAAALKDGFVVTGWSRDGVTGWSRERQSWTLVVTAQDAAESLLLGPAPGSLRSP
jgi:hypothetical protein